MLQGTQRSLTGISGFEIFNPKCSWQENEKARTLCGSGLVALGGSDAHYESDLGECVNLICYTGDLRNTLDQFLQGRLPYQVLGIQQRNCDKGRRYAPAYYRVKPYVRVPRSCLPMAAAVYRAYRNNAAKRRSLELETKYASE